MAVQERVGVQVWGVERDYFNWWEGSCDMSIPNFEDFMLPFLKILENGNEYHISELYEKLADYFGLSEEERKELLPSGKREIYKSRINWARLYMLRAGLIERLERGVYRITDRGLEVLKKNLKKIDVNYLMQYPEFREFLKRDKSDINSNKDLEKEQETPIEMLDKAYQLIKSQLAQELIDRILKKPPSFFEKLIIDLLLAMGYGGSLDDAGRVIGKPSDEGIDGIIKEDKLGLDVIYIQAKRWSPERLVGRPEIQKFVGALAGFGARKGIFITTSDFTKDAKEYIPKNETKIVLINGQMLANLMIEYNVGVFVDTKYEIKKIDNDYFDEE